jgi:toxin FitB
VIVLDTNVVSELMKPVPDAPVRDWLSGLGDVPLTTTAVTVAEIEYGLQRMPAGRRRTDLATSFEVLIRALGVLPLDDVAARFAGQLRAHREAAGLPGQGMDMLIAGIAATAGASLATRNVGDFAGLPLEVVNPWGGA